MLTIDELMKRFKEATEANNVQLMAEIDEKLKALQEVDPDKRPGNEPEIPEEQKLFPSLGHFLRDVYQRDSNLGSFNRLRTYREKTLSMDSDPEGGYLVPTQYRAGLLQVSPEEAIVRPRALVLPAGSPPDAAIEMPLFEQAKNAVGSHGDFYGGLWFGWTSEGGAKTNTETKIGLVEYKPYEWSGYAVLTDKIIRNANILEAFVLAKYKEALIGFEDYHFLRGTGVGQPLGIINSPAAVTVTRNTTVTILFADITAMLDHFMDSNKAVWIINKACKSKIMSLKDANNNAIWMSGNIIGKIPETLVGIPIVWTYKVPAVGTKGDIILADLSYYIIKDGYGPAFAKSEHAYFLSNKTCLKMFGNVDGKPWLKSSITADDNSTEISPFVMLSTK